MKKRKSKNKKLLKLAGEFLPFDYGFCLEIEKEMLNRMLQFFSSDEPMVGDSKQIAREIKLAINLLEIITEENSAIILVGSEEYILDKYVNVRNASRFYKFQDDYSNPIVQDQVRIAKAWYLYNKLRLHKMQTWWD